VGLLFVKDMRGEGAATATRPPQHGHRSTPTSSLRSQYALSLRMKMLRSSSKPRPATVLRNMVGRHVRRATTADRHAVEISSSNARISMPHRWTTSYASPSSSSNGGERHKDDDGQT
jgi:hypothetical protein